MLARSETEAAKGVGMVLLIRVVSFRERPVGRELAARFGEAGGTIGRGETGTLVLPDPERTSRAPTPVLPFVATTFSSAALKASS